MDNRYNSPCLKALTICEPWLSCILHHGKDIENRRWELPKGMEGRAIALHTSKTVDREANIWWEYGIEVDPLLPGGHIVAIAHFVGCSRDSASDWAIPGQYHWQIAIDYILKTPLIHMGRLGFWEVVPSIDAAIRAEIKQNLNKSIAQIEDEAYLDYYGVSAREK
jgi:activating signal cointegrator 1